ncbi:MAG: transglutaminase domain-containing protein [Bdellovibrionales bacterium]
MHKKAGHTKIFPGLFKNPEHGKPSLFLHGDKQTQITEQVQAFAELVEARQGMGKLKEIFAIIKAVDKRTGPYALPKHTNTAEQILVEGRITGCTDCAIAFATLARATGLPAIIVDSAKKEWIEKGAPADLVEGHFFVEVFVDGKWLLVDSAKGILYDNYKPKNKNLPEGYIAFAKAASVFDMGLTGDKGHNKLQRDAFMNNRVKYENPKYVRRDLNDKIIFDVMRKKVLWARAAIFSAAQSHPVRSPQNSAQTKHKKLSR